MRSNPNLIPEPHLNPSPSPNPTTKQVTRHAVKAARLKEVKLELIHSKKLEDHFAANPDDLQVRVRVGVGVRVRVRVRVRVWVRVRGAGRGVRGARPAQGQG